MARILLGWELGSGLGHVAKMLPVARALADVGHEPIFVLRDVVGTWPLLRDSGFSVLPSPMFPGQPGSSSGARSYADILASFGYDSVEALEPMVRAWQQLVALIDPHLVIAEHSPTLCLTCYGRIPVITLGTGFTVPCERDGIFPVLNPEAPEAVPLDRISRTISTVLSRMGQTPPSPAICAVLGDESLPVVVTELDPYQKSRALPALGPLSPMHLPPPLPEEPSCLVYLPADHPSLEVILAGLVKLPMPGIAYIHGATPKILDWLRATPLAIVTQPLNLDELLPMTSVVLHHGGIGITQHCLAKGRPQVVAPFYLERDLNCTAMQKLGVAMRLGAVLDHSKSGPAMESASLSPKLRQMAQRHAKSMHYRYAQGSLDTVLKVCADRLRSPFPAYLDSANHYQPTPVASPQETSASEIVVFFGADRNAIAALEVALYSLLDHNRRHRLTVHLALCEVPESLRTNLKATVRHFNATLTFHNIDPGELPKLSSNSQIPVATYFRLLIPQLIGEQTGRILYLDCDLLIQADIEPLWTTDLEGAVLAAVPDPEGDRTLLTAQRTALGLSAGHHYFDAGVLLIDLQAWWNERVTERALDFLDRFPWRAQSRAQNALNVILDGRVKPLNAHWNSPAFQMNQLPADVNSVTTERNLPNIIHYSLRQKHYAESASDDRWTKRYGEQQNTLMRLLRAQDSESLGEWRPLIQKSHAQRFCVMTMGRCGSTTLMRALESENDIALPNKDVNSPFNELLHPKWMPLAHSFYSERTDRGITTTSDLIDAFYTLHNRDGFAGFKSFPSLHPDFPTFRMRRDICFVSLLRQDFASGIASFMITRFFAGHAFRKGGTQDQQWTFSKPRDAEKVEAEIIRAVQNCRALVDIPCAIRLTYEQLCSPSFSNARLNEFFERPIMIADPKTPTNASDYVTNWPEFLTFVHAVADRTDPRIRLDLDAFADKALA